MLARVTGPARELEPPVGTGPPVSSVAARRVVALFVLPYVLLGLWWALANPAIAAPDEDAHLVKALGMARFDIGVPGPPAADPTNLGEVRNASITRVVEIPGRLDPAGYACFTFHAEATAACQPTTPRTTEGDVAAGDDPRRIPAVPLPRGGWVASLGSDPASATRLGRLVVLAASALLLWLTCAHLVRWLGRRSLVGVAVLLTPMAVFCLGMLNTSAVEILGATGMAAVVAVYGRRPESLSRSGTQAMVLVSGTALVLSRQLGIVTMAVLTLLLLVLGGWREVWAGLRERRAVTWAAVLVPAVSTVAVAVWELRYDHPVLLGPWVSGGQLPRLPRAVDAAHPGERRLVRLARRAAALRRQPRLVRRGGRAGRHGLVLGDRRDRMVVIGVLLVALVVSYVTYSRVFFGINAGLQGRHVLPIFALVPIWSGVVVAERLRPRVFAVAVRVAAVALPLVVLDRALPQRAAVCGGSRTRTRVRAGSSRPPSGRRRWGGTRGWFSGSPERWLSGSRGSGPWGKSGSGQGRPGDVTDVRRWAALRTSETCPRPSPPPLRPPPSEPAVAGRGRCCGSSPSSPR